MARWAAAVGATALLLVAVTIASTSRAVSRRDTSLMEVVEEEPVGRANFRSLAAIPGARRERALEQALTAQLRMYGDDRARMAQALSRHLTALAPERGNGHMGYPVGYNKNNGWHQEIETYDPVKDGCECDIDNNARRLDCKCGSAWGAITLLDEGCYGCCGSSCCNECQCSASGPESMGPTSCSCPLAAAWKRGSSGCPKWNKDNGGPLDPDGKGGIPEVEDEMGVYM
mmetsp:Transcript_6324/g.14679  ORF Transcript_6324/g.14679 Transcript_6324/m.14679 type:complete len:229 (+) Transcript_6324:34-720(+)